MKPLGPVALTSVGKTMYARIHAPAAGETLSLESCSMCSSSSKKLEVPIAEAEAA